MSRKLTRLQRPLERHIHGTRLVIRVDQHGVSLRGYRRRRWKHVTWAQLASLADESEPLLKACECLDGQERLTLMGVIDLCN